jgi:selenophosphate synthetase-related protein
MSDTMTSQSIDFSFWISLYLPDYMTTHASMELTFIVTIMQASKLPTSA